jgi:Xaa-Pro aminopeptidase
MRNEATMTLIQEKVAQAIGLLRELDIPCWLTFVRETQINGDPVLPFLAQAHLTWHSAFIVTSGGDTHAIVGRYDRQMVEETGAYREVEAFVEGIKAPLLQYLQKLNPTAIAINYSRDSEICDGLTHGMYITLVDYLKEIGFDSRLVSAEPLLSALRQRKTPTELARMKDAIRVTEEIFAKVGGFLAPGKTERDVADFVRSEVERAGVGYGWEPSTCPAVFTGPDTAEAHYGPTGRPIERGHIINMDFGVKVDGYCSDLQRTWYVLRDGETTAPPEVRHGFDTIVRAVEEARRTMRPGVPGLDVDTVARRIIVDAGFQEFPHALGHQVGRFSHDGTALLGPAWEKYAHKPHFPIEQGMVFTLEPRLTVPGFGIATVEEMVVVTESGAEFLSTPQQELILVG